MFVAVGNHAAAWHRVSFRRLCRQSRGLSKAYEATLANALRGDEATLVASGSLMLESEKKSFCQLR